MSDFNDVLKQLDRIPVRKATKTEAQNAPVPFEKYYNRIPVRKIQKAPVYLKLPALLYPYTTIATEQYPRMLFQYNVDIGKSFYVLEVAEALTQLKSGVLAIKYRQGGTVYRYWLARSYNLPDPFAVIGFEQYTSQPIGRYAVFEFWFTGTSSMFHYPAGLVSDVNIRLSMLVNPVDNNETSRTVTADAALEIADLGFAMPAAIPQAQPTIIYNSN